MKSNNVCHPPLTQRIVESTILSTVQLYLTPDHRCKSSSKAFTESKQETFYLINLVLTEWLQFSCHTIAKTSQSFFWHGCVTHVCLRGGVGGWEAIFRNSGGVQETMGWCKEAQYVPGSLRVAVIIFHLFSPMWTDTTGLILSVNYFTYKV